MSVSDPGEKIEWGADSEPRKNERVPSSDFYTIKSPWVGDFGTVIKRLKIVLFCDDFEVLYLKMLS
jgi:hypothetical protein